MDPEDTVEYGSSTSKRIERWWRELHERLGKYFKFQLQQLLEQGFYDREDENDRKIQAYVFIPIVQREIDLFVELWNNSQTRLQRNTLMLDGIPNVIYDSPEQYGLEDKGWNLCREELAEAAEASGVLNVLEIYGIKKQNKRVDTQYLKLVEKPKILANCAQLSEILTSDFNCL